MNPQHRFSPSAAAARSRQRGVYALEWAIIFPVFFMLLYAIISFGLAFLVRESMQWAAEDGARAALQYQPNREERKQHALQVVKNNLGWLPSGLKDSLNQGSNLRFMICSLNSSNQCTEDMSTNALPCDVDTGHSCMVQVDIKLPYAQHSFTPSLSLGVIEAAMPDLQAQAQILVDQKGF